MYNTPGTILKNSAVKLKAVASEIAQKMAMMARQLRETLAKLVALNACTA